MAAAMAHCVSCWGLPTKLKTLSLSNAACKPLGFSSNTSSVNLFSRGLVSVRPVQTRPNRQSIVCEAVTTKKADSAAKRARQAEKRRVYNKARKSEIRTRMKKVLEALEVLGKKPDAQPEEVVPVEKLIAEAYSVIDKAVRVGTLHRNTGARRKSRLARRKKAVEIQRGWYTPAPAAASTA
ncbi:30S ribosomal protein s20 chloroplastic [Phtheirospermum japonicum]|uniref:Small ribosomal subunit protein bS20c n=1 Tax=Phtheirospermum japonicum TaxID=374723 RepID=A0A830B147_9LAMI|nr:30S ribosomal protein s20 chloroplastic [Phtheirospermum japonicum]